MLLVNGEVVPLVVLFPEMVGPVVLPQQTPCAVIAAPPVAVTVPPEFAVVAVIELIAVVVTDGTSINVVKLISFPYEVPIALVAYALT
jgi:hypothetical protein